MNDETKKLVIRVDLLDNVSKKFENISKTFLRSGKKFDTFTKVSMKKINGVIEKTITRTRKKVDDLSKSWRKNTVAMLGVMFAAMGIQRAMTGLLRPAAEAFGLFDIWNETMLLLFIPIMEAILPYFMSFVEMIMNLPEPVKKIIGGFAAFALAITSILLPLISLGLAKSGFDQILKIFDYMGKWKPSGGLGSFMSWTSKIIGAGLLIDAVVNIKEMVFEGGIKNATWTDILTRGIETGVGVQLLVGKGGVWTFVITEAILSFSKISSDEKALGNLLKSIMRFIAPFASFIATSITQLNVAITKLKPDFLRNDLEKSFLSHYGNMNFWQIWSEFNKGAEEIAIDLGKLDFGGWLEDMANSGTSFDTRMSSAFNDVEGGMSSMYDTTLSTTNGMCSAFSSANREITSEAVTFVNNLNTIYSSVKSPTLYSGKSSSGGDSQKGGFTAGDTGYTSGGRGVGVTSGGKLYYLNDFIWRPGESPASISKDDTLIGFKGDSMPGGLNLSVTYNVNVSDRREMERVMETNNRKLVDDLRRMVKA